jgi:hypothetical protein
MALFGKLETAGKEVVRSISRYYPSICLVEMRKDMKPQDSISPLQVRIAPDAGALGK